MEPTGLSGRERRLAEQLVANMEVFNAAASGTPEPSEYVVADTDGAGELRGGVYGWTWGGTCWLEAVWVRDDCRREGLGRRLVERVEDEARARGCHQLALDSHTFQAPGFYRRLGFEVVGELERFPVDHSRVLMRKLLA